MHIILYYVTSCVHNVTNTGIVNYTIISQPIKVDWVLFDCCVGQVALINGAVLFFKTA